MEHTVADLAKKPSGHPWEGLAHGKGIDGCGDYEQQKLGNVESPGHSYGHYLSQKHKGEEHGHDGAADGHDGSVVVAKPEFADNRVGYKRMRAEHRRHQ